MTNSTRKIIEARILEIDEMPELNDELRSELDTLVAKLNFIDGKTCVKTKSLNQAILDTMKL